MVCIYILHIAIAVEEKRTINFRKHGEQEGQGEKKWYNNVLRQKLQIKKRFMLSKIVLEEIYMCIIEKLVYPYSNLLTISSIIKILLSRVHLL